MRDDNSIQKSIMGLCRTWESKSVGGKTLMYSKEHPAFTIEVYEISGYLEAYKLYLYGELVYQFNQNSLGDYAVTWCEDANASWSRDLIMTAILCGAYDP